ncbi:MAG: 1-phosphofructokinase [Tumebacillaceae bacterium]
MTATVVTVTLNPAIDKTVTVPTLEVGGLNRIQQSRLDPGGKGINVAKVLHGFGLDVTATGFVAGIQGQHLLRQLHAIGLRSDFQEIEGDTRTNLKVYAEDTRVTTEINENGFTVSGEALAAFQQKLSKLLKRASVLVLGGSLPPGVPVHIYRDFIGLANAQGVKTILDADGEALRQGIEAQPFVVKPNVYELEQLFGRTLGTQDDIVGAGRELLDKGISLVVISMGSQGSIVLDREQAYQVSPFPITPQSTVGAGDSMVAAIAYCLLAGKSVREIAEWATTAGTVTASKSGTQVCTLPEVTQHLSRVKALRI